MRLLVWHVKSISLYESTGKEGGELEASEIGLSPQSGLDQTSRKGGGVQGGLREESQSSLFQG